MKHTITLVTYGPRIATKQKQLEQRLDKKTCALLIDFSKQPNFVNNKPISQNREYKRLNTMLPFAESMGANLLSPTPQAVRAYINEKGKNSEHSLEGLGMLIKSFYKWLGPKEHFDLLNAKEMKFSSAYNEPGNVLSSKQLLSDDEVLNCIKACTNKRDAALIAILDGAGLRVGEALTLARSDLGFSSDGSVTAFLQQGKTGMREVRVSNGLARYVREWYEAMPVREEQTPLFMSFQNPDKPIYHSMVYKMFNRLKKTALITKPFHPHVLRHRHASWCLENFGSSELVKKRMGWRPNTQMLKVYSHVSDARANVEYERALGKKPRKKQPSVLEEQHCINCGSTCPPSSEFCHECNTPLGEIRITHKDAVLFKEMVAFFQTKVKEKKE